MKDKQKTIQLVMAPVKINDTNVNSELSEEQIALAKKLQEAKNSTSFELVGDTQDERVKYLNKKLMITLKAWKNKLNDVEIKIKFNSIKISDHYAEISYEMGLDQQSILALSNDVDNLISIWESNGQIIVYDNNFHDKPSYPKIKNSNPTNPYDTSHYYEGFYHARSKDNNENDPLFFITLNG